LPIAPLTYYESKARAVDPSRLPDRARRDAVLSDETHRIWKADFEVNVARKHGVN